MRNEWKDLNAPVQVASKDSLLSWAVRGKKIELPEADLVIIDEAHESLAAQWMRLIEHYQQTSTIIGLTATPCRADGRGLGTVYKAMVRVEAGPKLIAQGYLVPTKVYAPTTVDMKGVQVTCGEFNQKQVGQRLEKAKLIGDVVEHWKTLGQNRQTVIYCPTVAVSIAVRNRFKEANILAEHVDGKTDPDKRDEILLNLSRGKIQVVCNVGVMVQGVDVPCIGCIVWYTATASLRKFRQGNGRGKRPFPGKTDCIIIDHAGNVFRHGMPDEDVPWTLDAERRIEEIQKERRKKGDISQPMVCPSCHEMIPPGPTCRNCGHTMVKRGKDAKHGKGRLTLVGEAGVSARVEATFAEKQSFWRSRLAIAVNRGLKVGAAGAMYYKNFKSWPQDDFVPKPPYGADWQRKAADLYTHSSYRKRR